MWERTGKAVSNDPAVSVEDIKVIKGATKWIID